MSIALAGCGGGGTDATEASDQPVAAQSAVESDAAAACAAKAGAAGAQEGVAVSCDKQVVQYQPKAGALPVVTSQGPWLAQGSPASANSSPTDQSELDFGGGGGTPSVVLCPAILGASGRSGSLIDQLTFTCRAGGTVFGVGPFGGNGGGAFSLRCPAGFFGIGVQGGAGSLIDRLGFVCGNSAGQRLTTALVGGGGGSPFYFECAASQKLVGFRVRSGSLIDNLQPLCGPR